MEPGGAHDACAAIVSAWLLGGPQIENPKNNPMHSSDVIGCFMFFRSDLTSGKTRALVIISDRNVGNSSYAFRYTADWMLASVSHFTSSFSHRR
ncbi:hypothetical protein ACVWXM_008062 [Bradyrhizobium sp. GM7.3]